MSRKTSTCSSIRTGERWSDFLDAAHRTAYIAAIGSLIWRPLSGTEPIAPIRIEGYRKDFNTWVTRCRGTPSRPGLVLGLEPDRSSVAQGLLLRVEPGAAHEVWSAFAIRELGDADYVPTLVPARRCDTGTVEIAAAVLIDTRGASYHPNQAADQATRIIRSASGTCGSNLEYALRSLAADREWHGDLPPHLEALELALSEPSRAATGRSEH